MNDLELIELVAASDADASGTPLPTLFDGRDETLREIERSAPMDTNDKIEPIPVSGGYPGGSGDGRWRGVWLAAAVFLGALVLVGAVVAIVRSDSGDVAVEPSATTTTVPISEAEALAAADAYFAAYAAGDVEAILDLFAKDVETGDLVGTAAIEQLHRRLAWDVAQITPLSEPTCNVTYVPGVDAATVLCAAQARPYLAAAVGAPAADERVTMKVDGDGLIGRLDRNGDIVAWRSLVGPFLAWIQVHHPEDVALVECCEGATVEESIERGEARVRYADLWATYLEENGCVWNEPCEP